MQPSAREVSVEEILPWREEYRQEMGCQILQDSFHARAGWTRPYLLSLGAAVVGYGSVVVGGPWAGARVLFEFYVAPSFRGHLFELGRCLIAASAATGMRAQTNDGPFAVQLLAHSRSIICEKIIFHDQLTTALRPPEVIFRRAEAGDAGNVFEHRGEPAGDWVLAVGGTIAATGGILWHYNRPYGDLYMEVVAPFRRRGLGSYLVQELKRVCREEGGIPCARCNPTNLASIATLQKAGFVPCAALLEGAIAEPSTDG